MEHYATARNTMKHTLGTAAKACGISRSTVLRAIKNGRISATKDDKGNYAIEPVELHRVFQPLVMNCAAQQFMKQDATPEVSALQAEIIGLNALLSREQQTVADLRQRLDLSETERRETQGKLTAFLTDQRPLQTIAPIQPSRLLMKLFGNKKSNHR